MAASNYTACLKQMLKYEGGYSNHPSDPGGVTLEGVIQTRYNEYRRGKGLPLKALTPAMRGTVVWTAERNEIYRKHYWNPVNGDGLPAGVDLAVFDYGVNSGPSRSLAHFAPFRALAPVPAIKKLCARRLAFVRALRTWAVFGRGWGPRIASVEAIGVKMALTASKMPAPEVKKQLEKEGKKAGESSTASTTGGVATGGAAGGTVATDPSMLSYGWPTYVVGAVIIGMLIYLGYKAYIHHQRKKAYVDAAAAT
jgi:lysozyme family protein